MQASPLRVAATCCLIVMMACGSTSPADPGTPPPGSVTGSVRDLGNRPYPNTVIQLTTSSGVLTATTSATGDFSLPQVPVGTHQLDFTAPLSTTVVTQVPVSVQVTSGQATQVDLQVDTPPKAALLNLGTIDIFGEVRDEQGNPPVNQTDLLFARNVWDPPFGLLTAITRPNAQQLTLAEWSSASGQALVSCNGASSSVELNLAGLIPGGTYTVWVNFLIVRRVPGESVAPTDVPKILPLGSATRSSPIVNVLVADAQGAIQATLTHPSCILTDAVTIVMPVIYHINGMLYGGAHIPDPEEVAQLLFYF